MDYQERAAKERLAQRQDAIDETTKVIKKLDGDLQAARLASIKIAVEFGYVYGQAGHSLTTALIEAEKIWSKNKCNMQTSRSVSAPDAERS